MSPLFELNSALSNDTVVYRTLDFFGAAKIIISNQLMFSRADTFDDKNEGVDRLLAQLQASQPNSGCGMGWHNNETARAQHERIKKSHYISCWSLNPESVAMWSLYSPDFCSVRLSTTISKLSVVVENLIDKYDLARLTEANLNQQVAVSVEGRISPVVYVSLSDICQRIARRRKAYNRLADRYDRKHLPMPYLTDIDPKYLLRQQQRLVPGLGTTCGLKDQSFKHEAEVRLTVRLGEEKCEPWVLDKRALLDPNHQYHSILKGDLRAWRFVSTLSLPEREFVTCPANLIDTVAIDPRCPTHKADFMRLWFKEHNIPVVESNCFGYIPDSFDVYPEW